MMDTTHATPHIETHLNAGARMRKRDIMVGNFLGGLAWGVGSVLGATIVVGLLIWAVRSINFVPLIGGFTSAVIQNIEQNELKSIAAPRNNNRN